MKNDLTYENVIDAGKQIVMQTSGLDPFAFVFITFGIVVLVELFYNILKKRNKNRWKSVVQFLLGVLLIAFPFWLLQGPTTEEKKDFKSEQLEWKENFAAPFISEQLIVQRIEEIQEIEYNIPLEKLGKSYFAVVPGEGRVMPLKIKDDSGNVYEIWADTVIKDNLNSPYIEYQVLDKMLNAGTKKNGEYINPEPEYGVNYPEGIYNAKLFVNQEIYNELTKTEQTKKAVD